MTQCRFRVDCSRNGTGTSGWIDSSVDCEGSERCLCTRAGTSVDINPDGHAETC